MLGEVKLRRGRTYYWQSEERVVVRGAMTERLSRKVTVLFVLSWLLLKLFGCLLARGELSVRLSFPCGLGGANTISLASSLSGSVARSSTACACLRTLCHVSDKISIKTSSQRILGMTMSTGQASLGKS
jgi:hypothetical protein